MKRIWVKTNVNYIFVLMLVGYFISILFFTKFLQVEPWGDENHYIETVRFFMNSPISFETLKTYNEMHPPLAYVMFAFAGKLFGDHMFVFRIVTMLTAAITFSVLFTIYKHFLGKIAALLGTLFFMVNPYVYGLSVFVFSDLPGLMFLLLAVLSIQNQKHLLYLFFCTCTILCRQYNVFLPIAVCMWSFYRWLLFKDKSVLIYLFLSIASLLPFGLLTFLWKGIAPPIANEYYNSTHEEGFHLNYLLTYITILTLYLLPMIIFNIKQFYLVKKKWVFFLLGLLYFLFPVRPSIIAIEIANVHTIGFIHKILRMVTGGNIIVEDIFYYFFFSIGLLFFYWLTVKSRKNCVKKGDSAQQLIMFVAGSFLLIMTFSFFVWEKYVVPGLPFFIGWVLYLQRSNKDGVTLT